MASNYPIQQGNVRESLSIRSIFGRNLIAKALFVKIPFRRLDIGPWEIIMFRKANFLRVLPRRRRLLATGLLAFAVTGCALSGSQSVGYQARVDVAQRMLLSGQYESGYKLLEEVSRDHGGQSDALLSIGDAYLRGGAFFKARSTFQQASRNGAPTKGELGMGRVALAENKPKLAFAKFNSVLAADPTNEIAMNGLGVAFDLNGEHKRAVAEYTKLLMINSTNMDALNNLALSYAIGGSGQEAVTILRDLTRSQLNDVNLRHNLAIAYYVTGQEKVAYKLVTSEISESEAKQTFQSIRRYRSSR
jgi:Flp pilus assembly protein TadD